MGNLNEIALYNYIDKNDHVLFQIAKGYTAKEYYNQGISKNCRHIDILFEDYQAAEEFKKIIFTYYES